MRRPVYVVSEDLDILLGRWSDARFGQVISLTYAEIRHRLREILSFGDHRVETVSGESIRAGMRDGVGANGAPVVSLDPVYLPTDHVLQLTRCVDGNLASIPGLHPRFGFPSAEEQVRAVAGALNAAPHRPVDIILADDVVFTGELVLEVISRLGEAGLRTTRVVCGVAVVSEQRDPFELLRRAEVELVATYTFGREEPVLDEICERDFFVFSPMTGRSFRSMDVNTGAPYVAPFGHAASWASFGENEHGISQRLIQLNLDVIDQIEASIGRALLFADLERQPFGVRHPDVNGERLADHLRHHLSNR